MIVWGTGSRQAVALQIIASPVDGLIGDRQDVLVLSAALQEGNEPEDAAAAAPTTPSADPITVQANSSTLRQCALSTCAARYSGLTFGGGPHG